MHVHSILTELVLPGAGVIAGGPIPDGINLSNISAVRTRLPPAAAAAAAAAASPPLLSLMMTTDPKAG